MEKDKNAYTSIDEYIARFPEDVQRVLSEVRAVIHAAAPDAEERISYQMPAFYQNGNLVYFAANKGYIGFYPTGSGVAAFKDELGAYQGSKGSVHFPLDQPMPHDLITRMVKFRVTENLKKKKTGSRPKA